MLERFADAREDFGGASDVFPEDEKGLCFADDSDELVEEPASGAIEAGALASDGDVLAWASPNDAIHAATPRAAVEGCDVVPNRRAAQGLFFHPCHEAGRCVGFPLNVTHSSGASGEEAGGGGDSGVHAEVESSAAREKGENAETPLWLTLSETPGLSAGVGTYNHTQAPRCFEGVLLRPHSDSNVWTARASFRRAASSFFVVMQTYAFGVLPLGSLMFSTDCGAACSFQDGGSRPVALRLRNFM